MRYANGKIKLSDQIIDTKAYRRYPRVTQAHVEQYYDEIMERMPDIQEHFTDKHAFSQAQREALTYRPKLILREPHYPHFWDTMSSRWLTEPETQGMEKKYFIAPHCIIRLATKQPNDHYINEVLAQDVQEAFTQHPDYHCIIEVPDDVSTAKTKGSIFHEGLHYVIARYQASTGRRFSSLSKTPLTGIEEYRADRMINERCVEILTDKLLTNDPEALFEQRLTEYNINNYFANGGMPPAHIIASIFTGIMVAASFQHWYFLPLALVPTSATKIYARQQQEQLRGKLLAPIDHPSFKI